MINHKIIKEKNNLRMHEMAKTRERYIYHILIEAGILVQDFDGEIYVNEGKYIGRYSVKKVG